MLGILIPEEHIQKELRKPIKCLLMILIMMGLSFLCKEKILARLKKRTVFALIIYCYEIKLVFPIYISGQKFDHNLRGYDNHLIFCELNKFDVKIDVIPNGLEKYMAFVLNKKLTVCNL